MVFNGVIFYNVECIKNSLLPTESKGQKKRLTLTSYLLLADLIKKTL